MKHFLAVALLGLGLSFAAHNSAEAAALPNVGTVQQALPNDGSGAVTPVNGGWWAVPAVVGGVILFHHLYHRSPHSCYRRCRYYHGPYYCRHAC